MRDVAAFLQEQLGPEFSVFDYAATQDFNRLWQHVADGVALKNRRVVLCWDDTAPDPDVAPVATEPHVCPVAWAACAASLWPDLSIQIVEGRRDLHAQFPVYREWASLREEATPWVRVHSAPDVTVLREHGEATSAATTQARAQSFVRRIAETLTSPDSSASRHAITNLIGPLVVRAASAIALSGHRRALLAILRAAGFAPRPKQGPDRGPSPETVCGLADTRLLLVDDQWQHGWAEWIAETLGCRWIGAGSGGGRDPVMVAEDTAGLELWVQGGPEPLLERAAAVWAQQPRPRFGFEPLGPSGKPTVLLLDLRLFSSATDDEKRFLGRVADLLRQRGPENEPWGLAVTAEELDQVEAWRIGPAELDQDSRLTLFPRFLSNLDFTLPIILFSSSGRRGLVEKLKPYGNVVTRFEKPRFFGEQPEETLVRTKAGLLEGLELARQLQAGRVFMQTVLAAAEERRREVLEWGRRPDGSPNQAMNPPYAELYVDESGSFWPLDPGPRRVGGYAVLYGDERQGPRTLGAALVSAQTVWGYSRETSNREPNIYLAKARYAFKTGQGDTEEHLRARAESVAQVVSQQGLLAGIVLEAPDAPGESKIGLPDGPDLTYRSLAMSLVEAFLHDWLPALELCWELRPGSIGAGVFLGSRLVNGTARDLIRQQWNYGMPLVGLPSGAEPNARKAQAHDVLDGTLGYSSAGRVEPCEPPVATVELKGRSLGFSDAYAMVVGLARARGDGGRIRIATGVALREYGTKWPTIPVPPELPRQIHYASDDLIFKPDAATSSLSRGFWAQATPAIARCQEASRGFDAAATSPQALQALRDIWDSRPVRDLTRWLAVRAEPRIHAMSGRDFLLFALNLTMPYPLRPPMQRSPPPGRPGGRPRSGEQLKGQTVHHGRKHPPAPQQTSKGGSLQLLRQRMTEALGQGPGQAGRESSLLRALLIRDVGPQVRSLAQEELMKLLGSRAARVTNAGNILARFGSDLEARAALSRLEKGEVPAFAQCRASLEQDRDLD